MKNYCSNSLLYLMLVCTILGVFSCGGSTPPESEWKQKQHELHQQDSLNLLAQQRSLRYYDSLRTTLIPQIDSMLPLFVYEKQEQYEDNGRYIHPRLVVEPNAERSYIQAYVTDDVHLTIRCHYVGAHSLQLQNIILQVGDNQDSFSGSTYAYTANGYHETLTLDNESAERMLHFIDHFSSQTIRVTMQGNHSNSHFYLLPTDLQALLETYQLFVLMNDMHQLDKQSSDATNKIQMYQSRIQSHL